MARTYYRSADGRYVTDLDPQAAELWAVVGPAPLFTIDLDPLPKGWEYLTAADWSAVQGSLTEMSMDAAQAVRVPADLGSRYTQTNRF